VRLHVILQIEDLDDRKEIRQDILNWVWKGDWWQRHKYFHENRAPDTGGWFLQSDPFKSWSSGAGPRVLICPGIRKFLLIVHCSLLAGSGKSFITFSQFN
jgi:hypothetical protein